MKQLFSVCVPLVLSSAILAGQQSQPASSQKPAQTGAVRRSSGQASPKTASKHATSHQAHKAKTRRRKKRAEYRQALTENAVEVINGDASKRVVFRDEEAASMAEKNLPVSQKNPQPMKVEVVNGGSTDTQYFYDNGQEETAARNQPVVVGIQSSDTRMIGGNKHPVVTAVTASSTGDAKSASGPGQPVTKQISPRPKRPEYQPEPQ